MVMVKTLVLRAPGTNCDYETQVAFEMAGAVVESALVYELFRRERSLDDYQVLVIPGARAPVSPTPRPASPSPTSPTPTPRPGTPAPTSTPQAGQPGACGETYIVQAGDFPGLIAQKCGVDVDELMRLNGITDPASLQVGQELRLPRR